MSGASSLSSLDRPLAKPDTHLAEFVRFHGAWLDGLGIRDRPWLILGSAPDPTVPPELFPSHARIDINNAGRTAAALGLGRADLTLRAKKKSWAEHPHIDTRGLLWIHTAPRFLLRPLLINKPYDHIGRVAPLRRRDREAMVTHVSGASVEMIGDLGKVTNGVAAICYGLLLGVPEIVVAGISLSKTGHSYDDLGRVRRQVEEDAVILDRLRTEPRVSTTEDDLAETAGLRRWRPSNG
ncbi:putative membrane-anchored protein [Aurantimonas sp. 22II-16-19i]|nr:putative membrane-anchored protein [Aurantimonas sp. 22II-16-19i]